MPDNPLATVARLLGGIALQEGNLGHQVLGQLLIANTNDVAVAAAFAAYAGTTGRRGVVGQIALRTIAPALAFHAFLNNQEQRIDRKALRLAERERALARRRKAFKQERRNFRRKQAQLRDGTS
jgi:hypothetical protein